MGARGTVQVKGLVLGLIVGIVVAGIPAFVLYQRNTILTRTLEEKETGIQQLTLQTEQLQQEIVARDASIAELEEIKDGLEARIQGLGSRIEQLETEIDARAAAIATLEQDRSALEGEVATLAAERDGLQAQLESLTSERDRLQAEIRRLRAEREALRQQLNELQTKWNLWMRHADLAPQARSEYSFIGFTPSPGFYQIRETSFLVSFPEPANCLVWGSVLGTGSMKPALDAGHTTIQTLCFTSADLRPGDMIVYRAADGTLILHQILEVRSDGVIAKGIHNEVVDPALVAWEDIVSLVIAIIY